MNRKGTTNKQFVSIVMVFINEQDKRERQSRFQLRSDGCRKNAEQRNETI